MSLCKRACELTENRLQLAEDGEPDMKSVLPFQKHRPFGSWKPQAPTKAPTESCVTENRPDAREPRQGKACHCPSHSAVATATETGIPGHCSRSGVLGPFDLPALDLLRQSDRRATCQAPEAVSAHRLDLFSHGAPGIAPACPGVRRIEPCFSTSVLSSTVPAAGFLQPRPPQKIFETITEGQQRKAGLGPETAGCCKMRSR